MVNRLVGKKVVGIKQSIKAIKIGECQKVYIAKDADVKFIQPLVQLAQEKSLELIYIDTMKELGKLCGIDVCASAATMLKE